MVEIKTLLNLLKNVPRSVQLLLKVDNWDNLKKIFSSCVSSIIQKREKKAHFLAIYFPKMKCSTLLYQRVRIPEMKLILWCYLNLIPSRKDLIPLYLCKYVQLLKTQQMFDSPATFLEEFQFLKADKYVLRGFWLLMVLIRIPTGILDEFYAAVCFSAKISTKKMERYQRIICS